MANGDTLDRRAEALAEHDLEGVAGVDVVPDALHAGLVARGVMEEVTGPAGAGPAGVPGASAAAGGSPAAAAPASPRTSAMRSTARS